MKSKSRTPRVFILEDDPLRISRFCAAGIGLHITVATSMDQATMLWLPPYDIVLLDHDLGGRVMISEEDPNTGSAFCRWLPPFSKSHVREMLSMPFSESRVPSRVVIHSYNPEGAKNMGALLEERGVSAVLHPMDPKLLQWLREFPREISDGTGTEAAVV